MVQRIAIRDHCVSPAHKLDRVKLSIQRGPLGSFDRPDAERIALLWNMTKDLTIDELIVKLGEKNGQR